jgi:hypothetical protein
MFDGGMFEPSLVQKLRTHGMIRGFLRTLHDQDREWLLRDDETSRKALSDVQFIVPADLPQGVQTTLERLHGNIDTAVRIRQQVTLLDLLPPASHARVARVLALAEMSDDDRADAEIMRRRNEIRARHDRPQQVCCAPLGTICTFIALGVCAHFLVKQIDHFVARNTSQWLTAQVKTTTKATDAGGATDGGAFGNLTVHGKRMQEMFAWTVTTGLEVGCVALTFVAARGAIGIARRIFMAATKSGAILHIASPATAASKVSAAPFAIPTGLTTETRTERASAITSLPAMLRAMPPFWSSGVPVKPPQNWPGR